MTERIAISDHAVAPPEFWKLILLEGSGLVVLGVGALLLPEIASLGISLLIGWLLLIAGLFRFASLFSLQAGPGYGSSMLLAAFTAVLGIILVIFPLGGVLALTLLLSSYLVAHGLATLSVAHAMRGATSQWLWIALGAIADFILAGMVIAGWPGAAPLMLGIFVGINLLVAGLALILAATGANSTRT